jgi:two-component system nitrogen regulation response regulator GlnG
MSTVMIVDDEQAIAWALTRLAREEGHQTLVAASAEDAVRQAKGQSLQLVFLDVRLPGASGLDVMRQLAAGNGKPRIVVMTAFGDLDVAVRSFGQGAFEYLVKPFDLDAALQVMRRALATSHSSTNQSRHVPSPDLLLGRSPAMQEVFKRIAMVAGSDANVIISGESGVGKELVARAIHEHSARVDGPWAMMHFPAMSPSWLDDALDGPHGLSAAVGGTLLLSDIGEASLDVQVQLLHALEQTSSAATWGVGDSPSRIRLVATTRRDLKEEIRAGRFREDLYYRLAMFEIDVPPLRSRGDDVRLLAERFLAEESGAERGLRLSSSALQLLLSHDWPGNVRELRNVVRAAALVAREGEIHAEHVTIGDSDSTHDEQLLGAVRDWTQRRLAEADEPLNLYEKFLLTAEKPLFDAVLARTGNNRALAAEMLGMHRATLRKKLGTTD